MKKFNRSGNIMVWVLIVGAIIFAIAGGGSDSGISDEAYLKGNMANVGGSPTFRYEDAPTFEDDSWTSNDESNDQPVGFYGTETMYVCNQDSGNCYDLDVDSDGENVERIYFPKGGWVDMDYSECEDGHCYAEDENGTEWELEY